MCKRSPQTNKTQRPVTKEAPKPHYIGHRDRLKKRFNLNEKAPFADYELLELLLFSSVPRRDVKSMAKDLIARFGSFAEVLAARPALLKEVHGVGDGVVHDFKVVLAAARRINKIRAKNALALNASAELNKSKNTRNAARRTSFRSPQAVKDYFRALIGFDSQESLSIFFLNIKNELIADELQDVGTVNHTPVYVREIVARALELAASGLIIAHNHPSGDSFPSDADQIMTVKLIEAARPLGIRVVDHIIVGRSGYFSFRDKNMI